LKLDESGTSLASGRSRPAWARGLKQFPHAPPGVTGGKITYDRKSGDEMNPSRISSEEPAVSKPKRQHWVPRCYLRYFATLETRNSEDPLVWIFSKQSGEPRLTSTKQVAAECYLYSPKDKDGVRHWTTEAELMRLENLVAPLWLAIASGFVNFAEDSSIRKLIALFVATLYLRHPRRLSEVAQIHAEIVELCGGLPKDATGNPLISSLQHNDKIYGFDNSDWPQYKAVGPEEKKQMFIDGIRQNAIRFAELLMKKRWSIIFSELPVFITTDAPVTVVNPSRDTFGLRTAGTVISFPLSPTRLLIIDDKVDQPGDQYYPLMQSGPAPANLVAWSNCQRFMISSRHTDIVCAEMLALNPPMQP
jgi:hypothetical protein